MAFFTRQLLLAIAVIIALTSSVDALPASVPKIVYLGKYQAVMNGSNSYNARGDDGVKAGVADLKSFGLVTFLVYKRTTGAVVKFDLKYSVSVTIPSGKPTEAQIGYGLFNKRGDMFQQKFPGVWKTTGKNAYSLSNSIKDVSLLEDLVFDPKWYYFKVLTAKYTNGALRGNFAKVK